MEGKTQKSALQDILQEIQRQKHMIKSSNKTWQ